MISKRGCRGLRSLLLTTAVTALLATGARAEIAISANDGKAVIDNGVVGVPASPIADNALILDISARPPRVIAEIALPTSVVGPPMSVAIAPDESFALVTSAFRIDPADAKKTVPDDRMSVIDLKAVPPKVVSTITVGKGAAGVSINRAGTLALVANRSEGTVSVLSISGMTLTQVAKLQLGDDKSGPSHAVFTRDGKMALVTRDNDHKISILSVDGNNVTYTKRDMHAGLRPYGIDTSVNGDIAIVANIGPGTGDADTVSVIDLKAVPPRIAETVSVGQTPEGLKISPDGKYLAVGIMNGSNKPKDSPFFADNGLLQIWRIKGTKLNKVAQAPIGHWCQGIIWSKDSRRVFTQCMMEREIQAFDLVAGGKLKAAGVTKTKAGPAGIRTAEP
jgi:DNA-binding beta-propeller fold protein YncE